MNEPKLNPKKEKQLKFAEAGILFVLILAVAVFVGVRYSSRDDDLTRPDTEATSIATVETSATETATTGEPVKLSDVEASAVVGEEEPEVATTSEVAAEAAETVEPRVVTYAMAESAYHAGNYDESADLFNVYTDEHPANAWGYYMLGLAERKAGDADAAEEAFLAALDLDPDHQKSLVNYARVLLDLDRVAEARTRIETALAVNPASVDANRVMGRIQHSEGLLAEAIDSYRTVLQTSPEDVWALNNLGLLYIEQEQFTEALAPLAKATQLRADIACIQNNLGVALERTGHFDAAAEAFASALNTDGDYAKAEISLARVQEQSAAEAAPIDLAALAQAFSVAPEAVAGTDAVADQVALADDAAEAGADPQVQDMEVAAADATLESTTVEDEPEIDGRRDR